MPRILQACNFSLGEKVFTDFIGWELKRPRRITKIEKQRCQSGYMITTQIGPRQHLRLDAAWYSKTPPEPSYAKKLRKLKEAARSRSNTDSESSP